MDGEKEPDSCVDRRCISGRMPADLRKRKFCPTDDDRMYRDFIFIEKTSGGGNMPVSVGVSLAIILTVAVTTFATRALPFLVFPK